MKINKIIFKLIIILLAIVCILSFVIGTPVYTNDELWLFGHTYKLHNGYVLYKDINAIVPPLFFYFAYIVLSFFSFSILGFRIYNCILFILLLLCMYKLLNNLKITNALIPLSLAFTTLFLTQLIVAGASYNILAIIIITYGANLYISKKSTNIKQGLLIFLCFFTKQNFGIFYALSVLIYELIDNKKINIKYIKNQFVKLIIFLVLTILLFIILYFTSSIDDFFNYCIFNLVDFGNSNFVFTVPIYLLLFSLLPIIFYIIFRLYKEKTIEIADHLFINNMNILIIFYISILLNIYPIFNSSHFLYAIPFAVIIILYSLDNLFFKELIDCNKAQTKINLVIILILIIIIIRNFSILIINKESYHYYNDSYSPYKYLFIDKKLYSNYNDIKTYILKQKQLGKNVKLISTQAYLITNELNENNGKYDLMTTGNLGYHGEKKVIDEIKNSKNTLYLILEDKNKLFYQDSLTIRNYIQNNLTYVETVNDYLVYETKK